MNENYNSTKSLEELSDRRLLLLIISNQVIIYRQMQYLMQAIKGEEEKSAGPYGNIFKELIQETDDILEQAEDYMKRDDEGKGFIQL